MLPTRFRLPGMLLRLEGLAAFAISILLYARHDASWLLLIALVLAPDLSTLGYLAGPRDGTITYNIAHTWRGDREQEFGRTSLTPVPYPLSPRRVTMPAGMRVREVTEVSR